MLKGFALIAALAFSVLLVMIATRSQGWRASPAVQSKAVGRGDAAASPALVCVAVVSAARVVVMLFSESEPAVVALIAAAVLEAVMAVIVALALALTLLIAASSFRASTLSPEAVWGAVTYGLWVIFVVVAPSSASLMRRATSTMVVMSARGSWLFVPIVIF